MKHRSIGIFIILAAALAAIPQASQEISALRNAVGQRARVKLWNSFLALQSGGAPQSATEAAPSAVASCDAPREASAGSTAKASSTRSDEARREVKGQPRRADEAETALIIVDPSQGPQPMRVAYEWTEKSGAVRRAPAGDVHDGAEFAMFVAPGEGVEIDVDGFGKGALSQLDRDKGAWLRHSEIAELERQAFMDTGRELTRRGQREAERAREEIRRRIQSGPHTKGGVEVKGAEHFLKVFKVKATEKIGPAAPVAFNGLPGDTFYAPAPAVAPAPAATE